MATNQYKALADISVKEHIEKKGGLSYLSWATAWNLLKQVHPDAQRTVYECPETGLNFFTDGTTAYVKVGITVGGLEHIDYLPVLDYKNKPITLDKLNSFDVNKTIQRSTAKAIAMHGLGLSLWIGEDTAMSSAPSEPAAPANAAPQAKALIKLEVGDENWAKVLKYIAANKELGVETIVKNLSVKYKVLAAVKKEIQKAIDDAA